MKTCYRKLEELDREQLLSLVSGILDHFGNPELILCAEMGWDPNEEDDT